MAKFKEGIAGGLIFIAYGLGLIAFFWTVVIGLSEAGIWGGILSFVLPVLSNIYWVIQLWGENMAFVYFQITAVIVWVVLQIIVGLIGDQ